MEAPSQSPERSKELADLRRRAYGPDADIDRDPAAQRRLSELEALARTHAAGDAVDVAPEPAGPSAPSDVPDAQADAGGEASDPPPIPAAEEEPGPLPAIAAAEPAGATVARPWWRRLPRWTVTALAGVAAGVAIGIAIGTAIGSAWTTDTEPPPDLTLGVEPGGGERGAGFIENLNYWGVDVGSMVPHQAFDVIQVWTARGIDDSRCLLLSHEGAFLSATCSGAGLDPVLDFTVYDSMALELDAPLPVGTVIRFIGRDASVDVWVRPPGGQREEPEAMTSVSEFPETGGERPTGHSDLAPIRTGNASGLG